MVVASGAFALLIGAVFILLVFAIREQRDSARRAIRAQEAISAGNKLEKLAIDLETGVRGYVASGARPVFLQPYSDARQAYPGQGRELASLVRDNPKAAATVDPLGDRRLREPLLDPDDLARARQDRRGTFSDREWHRSAADPGDQNPVPASVRQRARACEQAHQPGEQPCERGRGDRHRRARDRAQRRPAARPLPGTLGGQAGARGGGRRRARVAGRPQRSDELGDLGRAFNTMAASLEQSRDEVAARTAELERSNAELDQFAAVTSHDLKEPLQTVTVFAGLLDRDYRDRLDDSGKTFLDSILAGTDRMRTLIRDLLEYSRVGHGELQCEEVPVDEMLDRARDNLAARIAEKGASLTSDPLPTVNADAKQLTQVFQNLLSNALKFSDDDAPEVHVSSSLFPGEWRFSVRDNGIGIDPSQAERIFQPFARLGASKEGTGIGLAICQKIVEHHGGRIWVESRPGAGSIFHFTIPDSGATEGQQPETAPAGVGA
jgi:signal transduction histidine kinase